MSNTLPQQFIAGVNDTGCQGFFPRFTLIVCACVVDTAVAILHAGSMSSRIFEKNYRNSVQRITRGLGGRWCTTLQRTNTENLKQIFPEKELRGHNLKFHIQVFVSDLYISTIDLPILLQEICGPTQGIYKSLTDTWMWKLGLRPCNSQKRNTWREMQCR